MAIDFSDLGGQRIDNPSKLNFSDLGDQPSTPDSSMMEIAKSAIGNAFGLPGTTVNKIASDPVTQAKVLPSLLGTAGALSPVPMGATLGTVGGRQLSNVALRAYGKPEEVPSLGSQTLEGALSVLGDLVAIPAMKKSYFGSQIGEAEKAVGVMTKAADKYPTSGTIGEALNTLENQFNAGTITDPTTAKTAKDVVDFIYRNPNIVGKSNAITIQAQRVSRLAEQTLNNLVPGRAAPAQAMGEALQVPRLLGKAYRAIPSSVKTGLGLALGGGLGYETLKLGKQKLLGQQ